MDKLVSDLQDCLGSLQPSLVFQKKEGDKGLRTEIRIKGRILSQLVAAASVDIHRRVSISVNKENYLKNFETAAEQMKGKYLQITVVSAKEISRGHYDI